MTFAVPQVVRHKATGDLLITVERYLKNQYHEAGYRCAPIDNRYSTQGYKDDELEPAPPRKPGGFDLKTEITPRIQGALPWEHIEPADLNLMLSNIAACAGWQVYAGIGYVQKPGESRQTWARFFLHTTQGAQYTGEAHALVYEGGQVGASAWKLSICKHEIQDSSTAAGRMRGWHPAKCLKCGLDLSVDSSD
jgi:hypothetical protein